VTYQFVPAESQVTYEVGEVFLDQGNAFNVAIGVTQQISGTVQVDFNQPKNSSLSTVTVDISQFQSDSARRDRAIRERFLESASFPIATFVPDKIEGLPDAVQEGVDYVLKVTGNLTIREVTKPASFDVTVRLEGGALQGQANTTILMSDYGFGPIDLLGTLKTEDEVKVSLQFVARPVV
jgi:polyisoprenoid-binding protein YceI